MNAAHSRIPDGGQLEDEPRPPAGHPSGPEARLDAARRPSTTSAPSRSRSAAVHRPAHRADPGRRRQAAEVKYGAQDLSVHDSGAYTGEISGAFLAKLGCTYVIVGHSERREYHHETDEVVATSQGGLPHGLTPIFCCGEGLEVRKAGTQVAHVSAR
jgi:triosephosphate isomerase